MPFGWFKKNDVAPTSGVQGQPVTVSSTPGVMSKERREARTERLKRAIVAKHLAVGRGETSASDAALKVRAYEAELVLLNAQRELSEGRDG